MSAVLALTRVRRTRASSVRPSPRHRGTPRSKAESKNALLCLGFCGQDGRALLLPGPSRPRRGRAGKSPKGRAHDARAFAVGTGTCRQRTSGAASRRRRARCPATAAVWVPFSWLLLFGQAKRSDPLAWMASGKTHGREAVFAIASGKHTGVSRFSRTVKRTQKNPHARRQSTHQQTPTTINAAPPSRDSPAPPHNLS